MRVKMNRHAQFPMEDESPEPLGKYFNQTWFNFPVLQRKEFLFLQNENF